MLQKQVLLVLSRALVIEYGEKGIRVNVIAPENIMIDIVRSVNQDELKELFKNIPQGFIGDVSHILELLLKLIILLDKLFHLMEDLFYNKNILSIL